jgi:hypothetical protein
MDVGSLEPSLGALEAASRRLRTTAMFRPKIPEVLAAVREAGIMYETTLRALDELPGLIARAEHTLQQRREGAPFDIYLYLLPLLLILYATAVFRQLKIASTYTKLHGP